VGGAEERPSRVFDFDTFSFVPLFFSEKKSGERILALRVMIFTYLVKKSPSISNGCRSSNLRQDTSLFRDQRGHNPVDIFDFPALINDDRERIRSFANEVPRFCRIAQRDCRKVGLLVVSSIQDLKDLLSERGQ
jgi:hypothetical protein